MIKKNKFIVCMLAAAISFTMTSFTCQTAYAAGEYSSISTIGLEGHYATDSNGLSWLYFILDDGTISLDGTYEVEYSNGQLKGTKGSSDLKSVVEIPSQLDGYKVSAVMDIVGYENRHSADYGSLGKCVEKVIIPDGVREIGPGAFARCPNLKDIEIPSSVNILGSGSFTEKWLDSHRDSNGFVVINGILVDGHKASGDVVIPDNIRCIGDNAFAYTVNLDDSFPDYKNISSVTIPSSVKRIGKNAFLRCNITKASIAEGVEVIDEYAFAQCPYLKEAKLPSTINELSGTAFDGDSELEKTTENSDGLTISNGVLLRGQDAEGDVVIPSTVTEIQEGAFSGNNNITSVEIPSSVKSIPSLAFSNCSSLKEITIENGVKIIGDSAFEATAISRINLPSSVSDIGSFAFSGCQNLKEVSYKDGTRVGLDSFTMTPWQDNLKDSNNFSIYNGVLLKYYTDGSSEIKIPDGVKEIAGGAFSDGLNNECITKITIPEGVTRIGEFAFSECRNVNDLYIPSTVKTIEYGAFDFCSSISFSGPGAQFAKSEMDNKYPSAHKESNSTGIVGNENSEVINGSDSHNSQAENNKSSDKIRAGWNYIGNSWYFGNPDGSRKTGWIYDGGNWYYLYSNGQMATAFIDLNGAFYYLSPNSDGNQGAMRTGWQKINGYWYYFNKVSDSYGYEGMMAKSGWRYIGGVWYYFYSDGTMAHDTWIGSYYVNSNGAWV